MSADWAASDAIFQGSRAGTELAQPGPMLGRFAVALSLATLAVGCEAGKGGEDDPLVDGKADSFFKPTDHGTLTFGIRSRAEITEDERFHAWTFELDGPATFSIQSEIIGNLDTVMYLYRRDLGSAGSFGPFIDKNDDHDGNLFSRIEHEGDAGEYRIIVKGFKSAHRGPFAVFGECTGEGCPKAPACDADEIPALPESPDLTPACASGLIATLSGASGSAGSSAVAEDEVCELAAPAKAGVDLLRGYWQDVVGWEAFKDGAEIELEIEVSARGPGTEVTVDTDVFDEDAITALFDEAGKPALLFQHNQSPDSIAFCDRPGTIAAPDVSCVEDMLRAFTHTAASEETGEAVTDCASSRDGDLPVLVGDPVCEFTFAAGLPDDAPVAVEFRKWVSEQGLHGAEVTLEADGLTETFWLGTTFRDTTEIFASETAGGVSFGCLEL
jgi:hypothetical protein